MDLSRHALLIRYPAFYKDASVHGYLAMRTLEGKVVVSGDLIQMIEKQRSSVPHSSRTKKELETYLRCAVCHFADG